MYERFTDRARRTMQLANQAAQNFCHEYIGTEHILLGLAEDGCGMAAHVMEGIGLDLNTIKLEIESRIERGPDVTVPVKLPLTPRSKRVIEYTIESARERSDNYVGTEHILLGLLKEKEGLAAEVLKDMGVTEELFFETQRLLATKNDQLDLN